MDGTYLQTLATAHKLNKDLDIVQAKLTPFKLGVMTLAAHSIAAAAISRGESKEKIDKLVADAAQLDLMGKNFLAELALAK